MDLLTATKLSESILYKATSTSRNTANTDTFFINLADISNTHVVPTTWTATANNTQTNESNGDGLFLLWLEMILFA